MNKIEYRADIDGLRGLAVIFVVIYHAYPLVLRGGFIGVDIFFVISGFLITKLLVTSLNSGKFSFLDFYRRRIIRIFPSLLIVLSAVLILGWFVLFDEEYKELGKHVLGSALFSSNFISINEMGYFNRLRDSKPLMHLWSLGIEEQFYLVWPLVIWWVSKKSKYIIFIVFVLMILSFEFNVFQTATDKYIAYLLPHARFWELFMGALVALLDLYKTKFLKMKNGDIFSFTGITLIVLSFIFIDDTKKFPGIWAVMPSLGTSMIIWGGTKAWLNRFILSNKSLVLMGLISFPLYLWHWPLLSFAFIFNNKMLNSDWRLIIIICSIVLAWITYKGIEKLDCGRFTVVDVAKA